MKHVVTVDSIFDTMKMEARVQGATPDHLRSLHWLEQTTELLGGEIEVNPFRRAELDVKVEDTYLRILVSEADQAGNLITNGEWCRFTVDRLGAIYMTTSHDPEFIHVMEAPPDM